MSDEQIFKKILDCAFIVHTALGPGLLESAYEECLYYELLQNGLFVEKQKYCHLYIRKLNLMQGIE
jgi:GxxExxY protein